MENYEVISLGFIELGEEFYYYNELDPKNYDQIRTTIDDLKNKYAFIVGIAKKVEPGKTYKYEILFWHKDKRGYWRRIDFINKQLSELYLILSVSEILSYYQNKNINSGDIIIEYRISEIRNFQPDKRVSAFGKVVSDLRELEDIRKQFIDVQKGLPTKDIGTGDTIPEKTEKKGFIEQINDIFKNASRLILLIIIAIVVITAIRFIKK